MVLVKPLVGAAVLKPLLELDSLCANSLLGINMPMFLAGCSLKASVAFCVCFFTELITTWELAYPSVTK